MKGSFGLGLQGMGEEMEVEGQRKEGGRELKARGAREGQKR